MVPIEPRVARLSHSSIMQITRRIRYALPLACLAACLWWIWPDPQPESADSPRFDGSFRTLQPGNTRVVPNSLRKRQTALRLERLPPLSETHPEIERVLGDDRVGVRQAALRLKQLALDASLPVEHRVDALEHGLNLDASSFSDFADGPELPSALAAAYLDEMMNENSNPQLQIRAYMALVDHAHADVAGAAREMLSFVLGDDFDEKTTTELVEMGRRRLQEYSHEARAQDH